MFACVNALVHVGAFISWLLFECLLCALDCMLTRVIRYLGRTAVYRAVECNQPACIEALVQMKADVNIRDKCACFGCLLWLQS